MAKITADGIVVGATFAGLILAREAADAGMNVVVLEWTNHIGGLITGGLGISDWVSQTRWGWVLRFFQYIASQPPYNKAAGLEQKDFNSNEAIAAITALLLDSPRVTVVKNARLKRTGRKRLEPTQIEYVELENGDTYYTDYWADASYECDLAAIDAKISMDYGRNSRARYDERIEFPDNLGALSTPGFNANAVSSSPIRGSTRARGDRWPNITQPPAVGIQIGDGGPIAQAYGFRYSVIYQQDRAPWPMPPNWRQEDSDRIVAMVNEGGTTQNFPFGLSPAPVSGTPDTSPTSPGRYSTNGGDLAGIYTNGWGDRPYAEREKIALRACYATMGANWTAANDTRITLEKRTAVSNWGLPLDEFQTDYIGFPGHPSAYYVRDDRSIIGQYTMTTDDMYDDTGLGLVGRFTDSICRGGYHADLHLFHRYTLPAGRVQFDGGLDYSPNIKYSIPLRACMPHAGQCTNLVVAWGISGSTIFRGSFRMEQTAGMVGHSLGILMGLAWQRKVRMGSIPFADLKARLITAGAIL